MLGSTDGGRPSCEVMFTGANFGAKPPLDAFLMDVLQTACTAAGLNQWIGCRILPHLADSAKVPLFFIRILQQQSMGGKDAKHLNLQHSVCN